MSGSVGFLTLKSIRRTFKTVTRSRSQLQLGHFRRKLYKAGIELDQHRL